MSITDACAGTRLVHQNQASGPTTSTAATTAATTRRRRPSASPSVICSGGGGGRGRRVGRRRAPRYARSRRDAHAEQRERVDPVQGADGRGAERHERQGDLEQG